MATRAQMIADINASRPDPYAHLTEEQLMAMLNHTDPKLRDAARQILASRKPKESTTADLVNETRPAPKVETLPEPAPLVRQRATASPVSTQVPTTADQYSAQAHAIIADLNARRRRAGGEVPEAPAMMAEINRLLELGNRARNAPQKPSPPAAPEAIATPPETVSSSNKPMTIVRDFTLPPTNKERGAASSAAPPADNGWRGGKFDWDAANREVAVSQRAEAEREVARRAAWDKRYGQGTYDYRGAAAAHMRNRAGMGDSTEQELVDVMRQAQLDDLARQAAEEDAVRAHNARVAGLKRGVPASSPADLDPVEAAATEVTPDPQVGADMSSTDVLPGPRPGTVRKWNSTTKQYDIVDASKPAADEPAPFYGRSVPGRDPIDGGPAKPSRAFASQEEADAYDRRPVLAPTDIQPPGTLVNTETRLMSSPRDVDMMQRGFVPVYDANGEVTYMRAANPVGPQNVASLPGDDWTTDDREGPLGKQSVLTYTPKARERLAETQRNRSQARAARDAERQNNVVKRAQARQAPELYMDRDDVSAWNKRVMSERLLRSGQPGPTPLDVEARQAQSVQDIMKQLAVGALQQGPAAEATRMQGERDAEAAARLHVNGLLAELGYDELGNGTPVVGYNITPEEAQHVIDASEAAFPGRGGRIARGALGPRAPQAGRRGDGRVDGRTAAPAATRENPL